MINPQDEFDFCIEKLNCHVECFRTQWKIPSQLPYFAGHFPEQPILPAVAMIDASMEVVRRGLGLTKIKWVELKSSKFMRPLSPGDSIQIQAHSTSLEDWKIEWKLNSPPEAEQVVANLNFLIGF
jgi:3-hydroxymyristoyl/3-hydroxydecanoyl-(acyl carrier protein) dehydratase